ncbi:EAL domain-containing protein [Noviherbaspirillum aridicola]|uniref:PAS domain S-box-containing protein/diguanylate cyclase (GGDEF)-like protein n=1 Tax=Noviherbaspirillum aridicola TaxID=2849687 RepID=A0ABQ4Q5I1_9BURK|nr:EAL domain-containing protein [Noviherbaspirillum aridicola]GIZ52314.1 hypothetical protein NCCP691_23280 [Noviherbaspirillum aridicola]
MLTIPSLPLPAQGIAQQACMLADRAARCAVMLLCPEGTILSWNAGAERLYGYAAGDVIGRHVSILHGDGQDRRKSLDALHAARMNGLHRADAWNRRRDGSLIWTGCSLLPLAGEGRPAGFFARLAVDLTPYRRFEEQTATGRWRWNPHTDNVAVSRRFVHMLGMGDRLPGRARDWLDLVHGDDRRALRRAAARAWSGETAAPVCADLRLRSGDGQYRWFRLRAQWQRVGMTGPHLLHGSGIDVHEARLAQEESEQLTCALQACAGSMRRDRSEAAIGRVLMDMFEDVRALQETQATLAVERERAHITLRLLTDSVIISDANGNIEYLNPAAERMTGWPLDEARGIAVSSVLQLHAPHESAHADMLAECLGAAGAATTFRHCMLRSRFGREFAVDVSTAPMQDPAGRLLGTVLALHDVSPMHALLQTLAHQASHDSLTGLLNRREFETRLQSALDYVRDGSGNAALIYLDLDQFKIVNDTCGHAAGDALLQQLARAYRGVLRERDAFARLGGDEFALVVDRCSAAEAARVADKLLEATEGFRFDYCGRVFRIGASIGVVPITARATSVEQLMRLADHACYLAKENGRHRVHVHGDKDAAMTRRLKDMHWVGRLNDALRGDSLELFYQPIAAVNQQGGLLHYEILLRLKDRDGSRIGPADFLPAAERFDLMPAIDRWVLKRVLDWLEGEPEHVDRLEMATINLSRRTLADESFQQYALTCLDNSSVPADKLCFEITENGAIADPARTIRFIETLKDRGCRFSLDDFGAGMTSFSYLKLLPVDFIKIDGSFVTMMAESAVDHEMVRFANEISHVMGRRTIAEYVSDASIYERLRELRIDYAQGNWIGAPRPLEARMWQ